MINLLNSRDRKEKNIFIVDCGRRESRLPSLTTVPLCLVIVGVLLVSWAVRYLDMPQWRAVPSNILHNSYVLKLDGVGPVDNRTSTDKLHHFVRKNIKKLKKYMWHVTRDMFGGVKILSKFQLPSSYCLWFMLLWRSGRKGWLNQSMNEWIN